MAVMLKSGEQAGRSGTGTVAPPSGLDTVHLEPRLYPCEEWGGRLSGIEAKEELNPAVIGVRGLQFSSLKSPH
ncbi:hypothetical protein LTR36_006209 [Oleoguttula mirabilis]|uniref:Uncharacterized protein n=1 Tax=Oleoguttula mirabilis TaxID=1507867 RepID=A0AAV9JDF1_9PEZI|nr:hypothetical protein LTR36_006209 [Oleoguttula mirabilis]